jgi:heat-inducible transcriptional repressor
MTPRVNKSTLKAIQVVPVENGIAMLIVVTNAGIIRNNIIRIPEYIPPDILIRISNLLNDKLFGRSIEQINTLSLNDIGKELGVKGEALSPILNEIIDCINLIDNEDIYMDGATNIFNYPEFRDIIKAKEFLNILDEKDVVCRLLSEGMGMDDIKVQIGAENQIDGIKDCSLITTTYSLGDTVIGKIGVIGPTRMEYPRVISSMNYIRKKINQEIKKLMGNNAGED